MFFYIVLLLFYWLVFLILDNRWFKLKAAHIMRCCELSLWIVLFIAFSKLLLFLTEFLLEILILSIMIISFFIYLRLFVWLYVQVSTLLCCKICISRMLTFLFIKLTWFTDFTEILTDFTWCMDVEVWLFRCSWLILYSYNLMNRRKLCMRFINFVTLFIKIMVLHRFFLINCIRFSQINIFLFMYRIWRLFYITTFWFTAGVKFIILSSEDLVFFN